ncbi:hypothetical protein V6Z12_A01G046400 [Gossypium hirsutum]
MIFLPHHLPILPLFALTQHRSLCEVFPRVRDFEQKKVKRVISNVGNLLSSNELSFQVLHVGLAIPICNSNLATFRDVKSLNLKEVELHFLPPPPFEIPLLDSCSL